MADRDPASYVLARCVAPESISRDAEIMVLGRHGFETAVKGTNGFVRLTKETGWILAGQTQAKLNHTIAASARS